MVRDRFIVRWLRQNPRLPKVTVGQWTFGSCPGSSTKGLGWGRNGASKTLHFSGKRPKYRGDGVKLFHGLWIPRSPERLVQQAHEGR